MSTRFALTSALASALLAACGATTSIVPTNTSPRALAPRAVADVQVFTAEAPTAPFVEVAVLQSRDSSTFGAAPTPEIIHAMRQEAALFGCDAVLVYGATNPPARATSRAFEGLWASCLVFTAGVAPAGVSAVAPAPVPAPAPVAAPVPVAAPAPDAVAVTAPAASADPTAGDNVLTRLFDRLDRNRDGVLSNDEIPANAREKLMRYDTSGEGWLTRNEMVSADEAERRKAEDESHPFFGRRHRAH